MQRSLRNRPRSRPKLRQRIWHGESLEARTLLAADLVAEWSAAALLDQAADGQSLTNWASSVGEVPSTAQGTPQFVAQAIGNRPAVRLDAANGADYFVVADTVSPLARATDFSFTVTFATRSSTLVGANGQWYENTGLVDSNRLGFSADWGLGINQSGATATGMGSGLFTPAKTIRSTQAGLNDGQVHVVAVARQGSTLSLYVDGQLSATSSDMDSQPRAVQSFVIGALTAGQLPFSGDLTNVRIYHGALNADEMSALYEEQLAPEAVPDEYFAQPGQPLVVSAAAGLLANDTAYAADVLTSQLGAPPQHGQLNLAADGSFHYLPNAGFVSGADSFTYILRDANGLAVEGSAQIVINSAADQDRLVINELHVNPDINPEQVEFIELFNAGTVAVDLSGWYLSGGVSLVFPAGTVAPAGGFVVAAQDPQEFAAKFDSSAHGPWLGQLSNQGEVIELSTPDGRRIDEVDYQVGFPWPTVGDAPGYSLELINPALDNELAGSWRTSLGQQIVIGEQTLWSYFRGREEPSPDATVWRTSAFDDALWDTGPLPIGYSARVIPRTPLTDMRNGYTSVYLRKDFEITDPSAVEGLALQALFDDGINVWINGTLVLSENVPSAELPNTAVATNSLSRSTYQDFPLPDPRQYLVAGTNTVAVQLLNQSVNNSDAYFDARLLNTSQRPPGPSPGQVNSVFSASAPPQIRQVNHLPAQPRSGEIVTITAKATDPQGVARMTLQYQQVDPGNYWRLTDGSYVTAWTDVAMRDDGLNGDVRASDDVFTAVLPGDLQVHRHLVRYRIVTEDTLGVSITVPYVDDPQPNFAYFVYDGVPDWTAADRPGTTDPVTFGAETMNQLPTYHLIADAADVRNSQYVSTYENTDFYGTLVYDGQVYDHVRFGVRGEFSTYQSGKNKWKFTFNTGHEFQAKDNYGREYADTWSVMNFSNTATPWVTMNRGLAGIDEAVGFRLFELAGIPSPKTNFLQFRVIDDAAESTADQYEGDLWGLYMTIEHPNGSFLDERGLPDGTTYKVENAGGDIKHVGATQPEASIDFRDFMANATRVNTQAWWETNVDLASYFSFRAVNRAINNMDIRDGWNHYVYHNGETNQWTVIPWDIDMLYVPTTHWSGEIRLQNSLRHDALAIQYRNRVRELQDLLFTPEQIGTLVDEYARFVNPPTGGMTMVDVDQFMWNYHPRSANGHRGAFNRLVADYNLFQGPDGNRRIVSADFEGMAQWLKDFMLPAPGGGSSPVGYGAKLLADHAVDAEIPGTPSVSYTGPANYPLDQLVFRSAAFVDPQGGATFGAMQWRLAEVDDPSAPAYDPAAPPRYEIESVWVSENFATFQPEFRLPDGVVEPGHAYRLRVRHQDNSGRWSHWSPAAQFVTSPGQPTDLLAGLRISEVHYHPADPSAAERAAGFGEADDFEFIELVNIGAQTLNLDRARLVQATLDDGEQGVAFDFAAGVVHELAPGARVLVVENQAAFALRYGGDLPVAGQWTGGLANGGETVTLSASGVVIQQFRYDDGWHPTTDGSGPSLSVVDVAAADLTLWNRAVGWQASSIVGGTPGRAERQPGDANHDGRFSSSDLVVVFQAGEYEDPLPGNSSFEEGDWDGDGDFTTQDLVLAFRVGNYSAAARTLDDHSLAVDWLFSQSGKRRGRAWQA